MELWLLRHGQKFGPYTSDELGRWHREGRLLPGDLVWHAGLSDWCPGELFFGTTAVSAELSQEPPPCIVGPARVLPGSFDEDAVRRLADYERLSAIFWMCLAVVQVLSVVGIVAGVWNIIAATSRFALVPRIRRRDPEIPELYEGMAGIVIIAVVNLFLGGVIGVAFAAFDFYVRDQVLQNRRLFDAPQHTSAVAA